MDITVSVLITFYNQKKYIAKCLESILSQNVEFRYEILCGDDGSVDGTYEELLKWQSLYPDIINVYQMDRDQGKRYEPIERVSSNRINLLKHSSGRYITFLDGDDYYDDNCKLKKQVEILERYPSCVGCGHPIKRVWENESVSQDIVGMCGNKAVIIPKKVYWKYTWLHADTLLFRNVLKKSIDDLDKTFFDDNIITCYHLKYGDIAYLPTPMAVYRQIGNSSWNNRDELKKAIVNIHVFKAASDILVDMNIESFIKTYSAWKTVYKHRNNPEITETNLSDYNQFKFIRETLKYRNYGLIKKMIYEIKYLIPMHIGIIIFFVRKLRFIEYIKIKEN